MGAWDTILKYGGKAMKGMGKAANATGKSAGHAVLHPSQTLRGAGQAVKMATTGAAVGYVGWEKLTTDKSVARIVSEAVVGKSATNALAGTTEDMKELKDKADISPAENRASFFIHLKKLFTRNQYFAGSGRIQSTQQV